MWAALNYVFSFVATIKQTYDIFPPALHAITLFVILFYEKSWRWLILIQLNEPEAQSVFPSSLAPAENTCPVLTANILSSKCLSRCCRVSREPRAYTALNFYWTGSEGNDTSRLLFWHHINCSTFLETHFSICQPLNHYRGLILAGISTSTNVNQGETSWNMFEKAAQLSHWKL